MKKFLKILLAILAVLVIAMFVIGEKYHYEKSIVINAPAEKVYSHLNSMKAFNEWNPWMKLDPQLQSTYSGVSGQVGDKHCWKSDKIDVGNGCQEITALIPNQKQSTKMAFEGQGEATSDIVLTQEGNATKVVWTLDAEMEYPSNLMKPMMDYWMGKSYEEGLQNLKKLSEKP